MKDNKTRKNIRHVALLLLAIASVVLSWIIWTNPARYEHAQQASSEKVQTNQITRDMSDVILPTQIIYTNAKDQQKLINSTKKNLAKAMVDELADWKLTSVTRVSRSNKERFMDYATMTSSLMLKYPSNITGKIFNDIYGQDVDTNAEISQIVVNLDKSNEFFLLSDKDYDVYQVKVREQSTTRLQKLVKSQNQAYDVEETVMNHHLVNSYTNDIKVPYYDFLVNKESSNVFTTNLLANADADSIETKKVDDGTEYLVKDNSKRLLVQNNGKVTYNNFDAEKANNNLKNNIEKGFYQIKQLGVQVDSMRYFNFHATKRQAEFRDFVDGFPIFNSDGLATIKVTRESKALTTDFSIYSLDVPVPTSKSDKELPSTDYILTQLQYSGIDTKKIEDIDIGYQWVDEPKANATVELEPTWFIKYRGDWTSYRDLIS
jgi:regulatory protein YycH of two-component signal transduction system YycFG